ncbi:MAG: anti-sigma factor ChrR (cupin superfamily) [Bradymonadia bacterium]|jgi:anti-sigma factor ChrR (cupin superfamily)
MKKWTDDTLFEWAAGTLVAAQRVDLEAAIATDASLATRAHEAREAFASVASLARPALPSPSARARLFATLDDVVRLAPYCAQVAETLGVTRRDALNWLKLLDDPKAWAPGALEGTEVIPVPYGDDGFATFLRMPQGSQFPHHEHLGEESVLVLQGRYTDARGMVAKPGDLMHELEGSEHSFVIDSDGPPFICLAVISGGLEIDGQAIDRHVIYGSQGDV